MRAIDTIDGRAYPLGLANVDTDVIIPSRYLKTVSREGLSEGAFEVIRAEVGNVFDDPAFAGAPILIAGENFGCGSSREHAAWAMAEMGIQAVIAPSFSDIYSSNAFKNGLLTVVLPQKQVVRLLEIAKRVPISIGLERQTVETPLQDRFLFEIDPFRKDCLLKGLDEIGMTIAIDEEVTAYETKAHAKSPWLEHAARAARA